MDNKTNAFESDWIRWVFNPAIAVPRLANVWLALFTSNPGEAGSVAGEPNGNGYSRVSVPFTDPVVGALSNSIDIAFGPSSAAWGNITHVGVCKGSVRGVADLMYYGPLITAANVNAASLSPRFLNGTLTISEKTLFAGLAGSAQGNATVTGDGTVSGSSPIVPGNLHFTPPAGINPDGSGTVMDTTFPTVTGVSYAVATTAQFQAAANAAVYGDEIVLQAGALFGDIDIPFKSGFVPGNWIVVRSSCLNDIAQSLYAIKPAKAAAKLATCSCPNQNSTNFRFARGTAGWWFAGLEFENTHNSNLENALVDFFPFTALGGSAANHVQYMVVDRCYMNGKPSGVRRGLGLNGKNIAVLHTVIEGINDAFNSDSQAIAGWGGPGPYKIIDCALEAASENLMWGGADPEIVDNALADFEIRNTLFFKRQAWLDDLGSRTLKNLLEIKDAARGLIQGCVFWGHRYDAQQCTIEELSVNQGGNPARKPYTRCQDIHWRYNKFYNVPGLFNIGSSTTPSIVVPDNGTQRTEFSHNAQMDPMIAEDSITFLVQISNNELPMPGMHFQNNMTQSQGVFCYFSDTEVGHVKADFKFNDNVNINPSMSYAFSGTGGPLNEVAFDNFCGAGNWQCRNNVMINGLLDQGTGVLLTAPHNNHDVDTVAELGLMGGTNYRFAPSSPFKGAGTGGNDPGPDWDTLDTLTSWFTGLP